MGMQNRYNLFWKKNFGISPFLAAIDAPGWTSGGACPGFQGYSGSPCLHASLPACNGILCFIYSMTPADLLAASMEAKPFKSTYLCASIGGAPVWDLVCLCLSACDKADALPNELYITLQGQKPEVGFNLICASTTPSCQENSNLVWNWNVADSSILHV